MEIEQNGVKAKIFLDKDNVDENLLKQIKYLMSIDNLNEHIRIMPDCHVGTSSCIGFTAKLYKNLIIPPNIIGGDIGCGISCYPLDVKRINFDRLTQELLQEYPLNTFENLLQRFFEKMNRSLECFRESFDKLAENQNDETKIDANFKYNWEYFQNLCNKLSISCETVIKKCIGKIGNGNHFIEICRNDKDQHMIVVHSGSKFLGQKVSNYHQSKFIDKTNQNQLSVISLEYIYDMIFAQFFSQMNREYLIQKILFVLNDKNSFDESKLINSTHNYIDFEDLIVRKGAIRAKLDEKCIVALNMKEGVLICSGKSNEEWNYSCAHGCGRLTSRNTQNKNDELKKLKSNVYLNHQYYDDLPSKYKPFGLIKELIEPTVFVLDHYKTVYNFKE